MKTIKWLWSIAFAFMIVLFYATLTSFFVAPLSPWYVALIKSPILPSPLIITLGWSVNYVISIIVLCKLIYRHQNIRGIVAMIVMGLLQIVWSAVFFVGHSLLSGLIVEIALLFVAMAAYRAVAGKKLWENVLFFVVVIWYCIVAISGLNILLLNA